MIDAHQHFWELARGDYDWLRPGSPLYRDFQPADLAPHLREAGVEATVLVQAAPTEAETDYLLCLARCTPWILGVVGWVDLSSPTAAAQVAARARDPLLVGLRPMLQDMADRAWLNRPQQRAGLAAVEEQGLAFDALVRADQIGCVTVLANEHPGLRIVLDHGGKPDIFDDGAMRAWREDIVRLAACSNVACKLSGLVTENPRPEDTGRIGDCIDLLFDAFGAERLMWGSDWPVITTSTSYVGWIDLCRAHCGKLTMAQSDALFGGTARHIYGLRNRTH